MGTRGLRAYFYKGRYYRTTIHSDAYPSGVGQWFASLIPRDADARQAWIQSVINMIEEEVAWRRNRDISDPSSPDNSPNSSPDSSQYDSDDSFHLYGGKYKKHIFQHIVENTLGELPVGDNDHDWTYVIDLDSRAFTINGRMHFSLDNMPPGPFDSHFFRSRDPREPDDDWIPTLAHHPDTPIEHIATVARWPPPTFDIAQVQEQYGKLNIQTLDLKEWGIPEWTGLSVAQELAAELARTILMDNAEIMSNPDITSSEIAFLNCRCSLLNVSAGNIWCPLQPQPRDGENKVFVLDQRKYANRKIWLNPHYDDYWNTKPFYDWIENKWDMCERGRLLDESHYFWFRGCLVLFCPTLHTSDYVQYATLGLVDKLRAGDRIAGIGLAFSGRHVLAVAVDGDVVRCSPLVRFHDAKMKLLEGFLIVTHLLSPHLLVDKIPWRRATLPTPARSLLPFPEEIMRQVLFQLDDDTYQQLPLVSYGIREMCARYPRVLDHLLLKHLGVGDYRVACTASGTTQTRHLQRRQLFYARHDSLASSFQYVNRGPHNLSIEYGAMTEYGPTITTAVHGVSTERAVNVPFDIVMARSDNKWPIFRIQIVHGIWEFVDPKLATSNFPKPLPPGEWQDTYFYLASECWPP